MVIQGIVILSLLITQTLCAPTGCIESCSSYTNQFHTQLSGISNHGDVQQGAAQLQGYDYSRPGTWTEHNDYNINNGKVHEERGQIVDGQKTVRYFKKNYSSSYDTRYPSGSGISEVEQLSNNYRQLQSAYVPSSENVLNFHNQRTYNQVGSLESIGQQQDYNRIQSQKRTQSAIRRTNTQSERLEDFGEHNGNSEVIQQSASGLNTQVLQQPSYTNTQSGNWSKVDSYKTDGGHGRVFEEEGQYTSGPKKVRYYKRNYTSSYSSSNGLPVPNIANIGLDNIHRDIENIHREIGVDHIHKDIDNIHREIGVDRTHKDIENIHRDIHNTVQGETSSNTAQTNINSYGALSTDSLHSINSDAYRRRPDYRNNLSSVHRNEQQHTSIASEYAPHQQSSQSAYGVSSYRTYGRREGHVNTLPTSQYINPTSGYTNVLSTGNNGYNRNMYNEENLQQTDSLRQAEHLGEHQSTITQNHMDIDNLRQTTYNQHNVLKPVAPGSVFHNEQWSSSHKQETSLPVYSSDISQISGQNAQYNSQYRENSFNSAHQTKSGKLMLGAMDLSSLGNSDDCAQGTVEHGHVHSQYRRIYKRSTKDDTLSNQQHTEQSDDPTQQTEDLNQQTDTFDDIVQQTSEKLQSGHESQQTYQPWKPGSDSHESEDLPQQTDDFDDLTQQTSGKIEFEPQSQHSHQSWGPRGANQHFQDITQQTAKLEDFNQQTSGTDDFEQTSQQSRQPWSQHSGHLTQQTDDFDDQTHQTGKLQFGQQSYEPWGLERASQHSGHLTQQTDDFDDQTHQTGKLQLGQQSYQAWSADSASQQTEDLTQQTGTFDDIVQQTSGKLQSGHQSQQSYQPRKPSSDSHESEVLPQQTDDFDDLTQQTSGKIDFGTQSQHSHQSWGPGGANQHFQDITQQTAKLEDFNQQTSGTDDFEQTSQQSHQPWSQHSGHLTQQTDDFDDQTHQTGKLQFGQQSYEPWGPERASQHSGHLTQQTDDFDDQMHQTGKLQLGQQSYQPWAADSASQHSGGWTQQTDTYDDQTQQTGKLQLGQQSYQPWAADSTSQQTGDLTQQSGTFDDIVQQTSGKLQSGHQSQQTYQPWKPGSDSHESEDLPQQTDDFDDLTQQTSGKIEFGTQSQHSHQSWGPRGANQHFQDITQQTAKLEDFNQQTSGTDDFEQTSQQSHQPWSQHSGHLTQQTDDFDDQTHQTGKLQFGQQSYEPWGPERASQHSGHLTQQTDDFDDQMHQTGKLQLGQQSYQPWAADSASQHSGGWSQQTDTYDDQTQQAGKLQLGQQSYQPWGLESASQQSEDMTQQNEHVLPVSDINDNIPVDQASHTLSPTPVGKPRPRPRYSRVGSLVGLTPGSHSVQGSNNIQPSRPGNEDKLLIEVLNHSSDKSVDRASELPPVAVPGTEADGTRSQDLRGDQGVGSSTNTDKPSTQKTEGLQWHYTYHPSDQRQLVQQADKKDKGGIQQQSTIPDFSDPQDNLDQQQAQNKHIFEDLNQQSSSPGKTKSGMHQQSQNGQEKDQLEVGQQTLGKTEDNPQHRLEPRILQAYGGGPYDDLYHENIYAGVTVNPSATLAPINTADSWDIREKPADTNVPVYETTLRPLPVEPLSPDTNEPTPAPSFWSRLGNKFTNTFDKAKEKARNIFG